MACIAIAAIAEDNRIVIAEDITEVQTSDIISRVQGQLKAQGFDPGPPDGAMGPKTREALRGFQSARRLQVTGEIDKTTLEALGVEWKTDLALKEDERTKVEAKKIYTEPLKSPIYGSWQTSFDMTQHGVAYTITYIHKYETDKLTIVYTCRGSNGLSVSTEISSPIKVEKEYIDVLNNASKKMKRNCGDYDEVTITKGKYSYKIDGDYLIGTVKSTGTKTILTRVK